MDIQIVHADAGLVVVAKRPGVPTQSDRSGDPSAHELAERQLGRSLHLVHRIDRPASGLVAFAAPGEAVSRLSGMLREGGLTRRYWAIVASGMEPPEGTLVTTLRHDTRANRSRVHADGKRAELRYETRARGDRYDLLEVTLLTGRHHQIRAQLAAAGRPIRGDLKYGAPRSLPGGGIALHAVLLALTHPLTGEQLVFTAPPPDDRLWHALTDGLEPRRP